MNIGKCLKPRAFAPCSERDPSNLVNDSGMSGTNGIEHKASCDLTAMWLTVREPKEKWVAFDFGSILRLGQMYIWNFNQSDGFLSGIKNVEIEFSTDGINYFSFKGNGYPYIFAVANGKDNLKATNLVSGDPVDFDGLSARFIRLTPKGGKGEGNYGNYIEAQERYGLSAVRFYQYRAEPKKGGYLYATCKNSAMNVITSSYGLSEKGHSTNPEAMYFSEVIPSDNEIVLDMHMTATIKGLDIYNYNVPGELGAGLKAFSVLTSIDGQTYKEVGEYTLAIGTGKENASASKLVDGTDLIFEDTYCRFVKVRLSGGLGIGCHGQSGGFCHHFGVAKILIKAADKGHFYETDRIWTSRLSNYKGWTGADGIFTAAINGNNAKREGEDRKNVETLMLFSDTFIGEVNPITKERRKGYFANNTLGYLKGCDYGNVNLDLVYRENSEGVPTSILDCDNPWIYWMQDCAIIDGKFYVFTDNVITDNENTDLLEGFRFKLCGVDLISANFKNNRLDYESQKATSTTLFVDNKQTYMYFGCGVFVNTKSAGMPTPDGYVYVYGIRTEKGEDKKLVVARTKPEDIEKFNKYRFYNGSEWVSDIMQSAPICDQLSPEMSVMPIETGEYKGQYLYTYSHSGVGDKIMQRVSKTPYGVFSDAFEAFYMGDIDDLDKHTTSATKIYQYNSKAHFHLAPKGEVLITYNVNALDYESHLKCSEIYRPRFVRGKTY